MLEVNYSVKRLGLSKNSVYQFFFIFFYIVPKACLKRIQNIIVALTSSSSQSVNSFHLQKVNKIFKGRKFVALSMCRQFR